MLLLVSVTVILKLMELGKLTAWLRVVTVIGLLAAEAICGKAANGSRAHILISVTKSTRMILKQYFLAQRCGINVTPLNRMPERPWCQGLVVMLISGAHLHVFLNFTRSGKGYHCLIWGFQNMPCRVLQGRVYNGPKGGPCYRILPASLKLVSRASI